VIESSLPDRHIWLRLTQPHHDDAFDMPYAREIGGRWNPPSSWATLYLNDDMATVHAQVRHLFAGRGIDPDDLDDSAPIELAAATLPQRQRVADVVSDSGVASAGLPATYPLDDAGVIVDQALTQNIGVRVHDAGLRGVWCRSATMTGNELAWSPAGQAVARPSWSEPLPFASWRHAVTLADVIEP